MAFTELTQGTPGAFTEITGISSKDIATNEHTAEILTQMSQLLSEISNVKDKNKDKNKNKDNCMDMDR